jgi:hypothetical protein
MEEISWLWLIIGFAWGFFMRPVIVAYYDAAKEIYNNAKKDKDEGSSNNR